MDTDSSLNGTNGSEPVISNGGEIQKLDWEDSYVESFLMEYGAAEKAAAAINIPMKEVTKRLKDSPVFAEKVAKARSMLRDVVRHEVLRRALEPTEKPIFQRGQLVGKVLEWDTRHLEWVAERMLPEEFHLPSRIEFAGDSGDGTVSFKLELGDAKVKEEDDPDGAEAQTEQESEEK